MNKKYSKDRPPISAELEREVKVRAGHNCEVRDCPEYMYLHIHHIDENRENNTLENLALLCQKHHAMAHDGQIDRKALRRYTTTRVAAGKLESVLDKKVYAHINNGFVKDDFINAMRVQGYVRPIPQHYVDNLHALTALWIGPLADFEDEKLNGLNMELREACNKLSRLHALKTFPSNKSPGFYEVPKEYDADIYQSETMALYDATQQVCQRYDALTRLAISLYVAA